MPLPTNRTTSDTIQEHIDDHNALNTQHNELEGHADATTDVHGIADTADLATQADLTAAINGLVDAAPGTLDTLNELAAALGDDANYASTVTTALAGKAATTHTHAEADVTSLTSDLAGKASTSHHTAHQPGGSDAMAADAAAATASLRTLGTSSTQAAAGNHAHSGAYVAQTLVDAKGDLIVGTADDTVARLPVGTNGQVLTAASGQSSGLQWASPGGSSGLTLISSQVLGAAAGSVSFSSLGSYASLRLVCAARSTRSSSQDFIALQFNGDTGTNYQYSRAILTSTFGFGSFTSKTYIEAARIPGANAGANMLGIADILIPGYADSTFYQPVQATGAFDESGGFYITAGTWNNTAAVTSIVVLCEVSTFVAGSRFDLYGMS